MYTRLLEMDRGHRTTVDCALSPPPKVNCVPSPPPSPPPDVSHNADADNNHVCAPASSSASRVGKDYQATLPSHGELSSDRSDTLLSIAEIEAEMAADCAKRLTASVLPLGESSDCPVLMLARREGWLKQQPKVPRPRCGTWGCTLPDRHSGLHKVSEPPESKNTLPSRSHPHHALPPAVCLRHDQEASVLAQAPLW